MEHETVEEQGILYVVLQFLIAILTQMGWASVGVITMCALFPADWKVIILCWLLFAGLTVISGVVVNGIRATRQT